MADAGVFDDCAIAALLFGAFAIATDSGNGDESIGRTMKDECWRKTFGDVFVRGKIGDRSFVEEDALKPVVVYDRNCGRNHDQGHRRRESAVLLCVIDRCERRSELAAGGDAVGCNAAGIDAEVGSVVASPAKYVACVRKGIEGRYRFLIAKAIFDGDGDGAILCVTLRRLVDPLRRAGDPSSAMK